MSRGSRSTIRSDIQPFDDTENFMNRSTTDRPDAWSDSLEARIRKALCDIRFGTITLVIQDRRVIQIDRNEKIRL